MDIRVAAEQARVAQRLRAKCLKLRTQPTSLAELIPLMQEAADLLDTEPYDAPIQQATVGQYAHGKRASREAALAAQPSPVEAQAVPDQPVAQVCSDEDSPWYVQYFKPKELLPVGTQLFTRPTPAAADLHQQIMNLPINWTPGTSIPTSYLDGHRDARHAAAQLVAASPAAAAQQSITKEQALESLSEVGLWLSRDPHALRLRQFIEQASPAAAAPQQYGTLSERAEQGLDALRTLDAMYPGSAQGLIRQFIPAAAARRPTDDELNEWAERHDLGSLSLTDLRCIFEDAQTLVPVAASPAAAADREKLEILGSAIAAAAKKAGIYNGEVPLAGPHLLQLLDDLASGPCASSPVAPVGAPTDGEILGFAARLKVLEHASPWDIVEFARALLSRQGCELATDATKQLGEHFVHPAGGLIEQDFRDGRALPAAAPEGWRLVPVEPTDAMVDADWDVSMSEAHSNGGVSAAAWRAMLEAAPQATYGNGHSGLGWYAHDTEYPEEGAMFLGEQSGDGSPARQGAEPDGQDLNPVSVKDLSASASPATKEQQ